MKLVNLIKIYLIIINQLIKQTATKKQSLLVITSVNNQPHLTLQPLNLKPSNHHQTLIAYTFHPMRRHVSKDKQIPISEKVKKMFRYSPSYEAQKCYSKLPLRYSYATSFPKLNSLRQSEINCDYSSVKEKHLETNQCNDTSSWIAKLVSGIQDSDDQNKNLHKLSQIQNHSLNDFPEDSQHYADNEFLPHQTYHLFNPNTHQNTPKPSKFLQQVPITNPIKKSIKQALIEIQLNQIKQGMKVPPVTRANSTKKQKENPKMSKINSKCNSNDKNPREKSTFNEQTIKSPLKQKPSNKRYSTKSVKSSLLSHKPKSQAKRKMKTQQKFVQKSIQVEDLNVTYNENEDFQKIKGKTFESQDQSSQSLDAQTCKNSLINSGTKKQSINRVKNEASDFKTRKNSLINKEELNECEDKFNMVDQYSRNLNMKNLFSEENQPQQKAITIGQTVLKPFETNKRVGGIKKNILAKDNVLQNKKVKDSDAQNLQLEGKLLQQKENEMQLKYSYLSTKRQSKNITLKYRNSDPIILIELDQNPFPSSRRQPSNLPSKRNQLQKPSPSEAQKSYHQPLQIEYPEKRKPIIQNQQIQSQNTQRILYLFNKLKLDPTKDFLDKNNLKIRGLNQYERTQLGSIIAKIHYQDTHFDINSFERQFRKMNFECTQSGCLSQQKLHKIKAKSPVKQILPLNSVPKAKQDIQKPLMTDNVSFQKQDENQIVQVSGMGHRRRNSKIIKKKLFEEIKRISYLQEVATNQLEKNSRITQKGDCKENTSLNNPIKRADSGDKNKKQPEQYISKDPYIEAPSLCDIQMSRRNLESQKNQLSDRLIEQCVGRNGDYNFKGFSELAGGNDTCLIERLNKKLSSYIDKNQIQNTFRQFNLNFSQLKKHFR